MPVLPLSKVVFKRTDFEHEGLSIFNTWVDNVTAKLNQLQGFGGPLTLANKLDMNNNRLQNLANPIESGDAVSKSYADSTYGPSAVQPQLEQLGNSILQSVRRLGDPTQREGVSSFLNSLMSTAPSTNTATIGFGSPSGGSTPVNISAGLFQQLDGTQIPFSAFNDSVTTPGSTVVYYYYLPKNSTTLARVGPFSGGDSWANRLNASYDGNQIIAVATLNAGGGVVNQSAAGGTLFSTTSGVIISRL